MHAYRLPLSVALVSITTPVHLMVRHRSGDPGPLAVPCAEQGANEIWRERQSQAAVVHRGARDA